MVFKTKINMKILTDFAYKKALEKNEEGLRKYYIEKITSLEKQLEESKNLKDILKIIEERRPNLIGNEFITTSGGGTWTNNLSLTDNVLVYVNDILGGKVIKQEGIKCIIVEKDGTVKNGLTKQKPTKGQIYKLVIK